MSAPLLTRGRIVVTAVAGSALAVAGQAAVSHALHGANPLQLLADAVTGSGVQPPTGVVGQLAAAQPVPIEPEQVDAAALIRAAELADLTPVAAPARPAPASPARPSTTMRKAPTSVAPSRSTAPSAAVPLVAKPASSPVAKPAPAPVAKPAPAPVAAGGFARPVQGRVTSGFGVRGGTMHYGLDIANAIGTPIHAVASGTVISAGPASGFGLWVRLRHADGTITVYGHVNRFFVTVGQQVTVGQVIAEVGNRGESTGPHLHIEVHTPSGQKIDPRPWLAARGITY